MTDPWRGEYRGKLPPGAQEMLDRNVAGWREAESCGLRITVEIPPPGPPWPCPVAEAHAGERFTIDALPPLPWPGCERLPCCCCGYVAIAEDPE